MPQGTSLRRRRGVWGVSAVVAVALAATFALAPIGGTASSHREAPLVAADPQVDNTDLYVFRSPDKPGTITFLSNWIPFEEPAGGPNFYAFAEHTAYDIKIDNDADGVEDITYQWTFTNHYRSGDTFLYNTGPVTSLTDTDLNFWQTYDLRRIDGSGTHVMKSDAPVVPSRVGAASMPNYSSLAAAGIKSFASGTSKVFAGQADDTFFLDLRVFDFLYGGNLSEVGDDTLDGFNVNTLALQVPRGVLAMDADVNTNPIIGVWSTAERPSVKTQDSNGDVQFTGAPVEVSRLGMPLVNEVVIPVGDKDKWNGSAPVNDLSNFGSYITSPELPKLMEAVYGIPAPAEPRNDLVAVFATGISGLNQPAGVTPSEMIRLNMTTPVCLAGSCAAYSRLGVIGGDNAGYPNGRRLADDTIDISLQVVEGELVGNPNDLGDGVNTNDRAFQSAFPYVALPFSGSNADPH